MTEEKKDEAWHQKQLVQWCKQFSWGQFLYHVPNESVGGYGWMIRNRQMGMRKGVPDLVLPIPMRGFHGLYIEMKTEKGRLSTEQKRWADALKTFGYCMEVAHGWEEARDTLSWYMEVNKG
jgi:hypothetical protein